MHIKKLIIHSQESLRFVPHNDIYYCKSDNCYTSIFLGNGEEIVMCKSLKKVTEELNPDIFIRVNQSYVINKNFIIVIDKKHKLIELASGKKIPFTTTLNDLIDMMGASASLLAVAIFHPIIVDFINDILVGMV